MHALNKSPGLIEQQQQQQNRKTGLRKALRIPPAERWRRRGTAGIRPGRLQPPLPFPTFHFSDGKEKQKRPSTATGTAGARWLRDLVALGGPGGCSELRPRPCALPCAPRGRARSPSPTSEGVSDIPRGPRTTGTRPRCGWPGPLPSPGTP